MMKTTTILSPEIKQTFNKFLLSLPYFRFDADYIFKIARFIMYQGCGKRFEKTPKTFDKLEQKYCEFMSLYEQAKRKEEECKGKTFIKTQAPFYRPRFGNEADENLFKRLDNRRKTSGNIRKRNEIQKV